MLPVVAVVLGVGELLFGFARGSLWKVFVAPAVAGLGMGLAFAALPGLIVAAVPAGKRAVR